jgi:hypothetical protein
VVPSEEHRAPDFHVRPTHVETVLPSAPLTPPQPRTDAAAGTVPASGRGSDRAQAEATMRVAVVSTYPPRACGIGTFSSDLRAALLCVEDDSAVDLVAI